MESNVHFKSLLETELQKITAELSGIASHNEATDDWVAVPVAKDLQTADENEEADAVEEWEVRRALMVQLETQYKNIKRALAKFETGTFGVCEICGEPIELDRLEANPSARTNIAHREEENQLPS